MTRPETMQAAYIRAKGGPECIEYGELPVPQPGPTDVLVRVEASEVNNVDLFVRSGAYPTHTPLPFVIGRDLVGSVVAAGLGVADFEAGDRVWCNSLGYDGRQGAFAEYAVVPAERLYPLPERADPHATVALLHGAATAWLGLVREADVRTGDTVFIEGGAGSVGSASVQMATALGARVVVTASSHDADWCRRCGAEAVVDYHLEDRYERIRRASPEGIDVWWDTSGHNNFTACLPLLNRHARVLVMAGLQHSQPVLPVGALYTREVTLHGFAMSNATAVDLARAAQTINRLLDRGQLQARIGATYSLAEAARAHEAMATGAVRGRIVVTPQTGWTRNFHDHR